MRLSVLPRLPTVSAGFVVARLFSSYLVSSPQWSVSSAFAPKVPVCSLPKIRSWSSSPALSKRTILFDVASTGNCYDSSVLRLLNEDDAQKIDFLVQERSKARWQGNYTVADDLKAQILEYPDIPSGYELVLKDIPRNEGGGSQWNLVHTKEIYDEDILSGSTILQLAHAAMGRLTESESSRRWKLSTCFLLSETLWQLRIDQVLEKNWLRNVPYQIIIDCYYSMLFLSGQIDSFYRLYVRTIGPRFDCTIVDFFKFAFFIY